jgi:pyruvate kinase
MLSEETAIGLFPVQAVRAMNSISRTVEMKAQDERQMPQAVEGSIAEVIGSLASRAARTVDPAAIIVVTRSGFSVRMVSKYRPRARILAVTQNAKIGKRSRLYWGVEPLDVPWREDREELLISAVERSLELGYIDTEDKVMIVSGSNLEAPGRTSTLEILNVNDVIHHASRI